MARAISLMGLGADTCVPGLEVKTNAVGGEIHFWNDAKCTGSLTIDPVNQKVAGASGIYAGNTKNQCTAVKAYNAATGKSVPCPGEDTAAGDDLVVEKSWTEWRPAYTYASIGAGVLLLGALAWYFGREEEY